MVRIVHAADLHLDSPLRGLARLGDRGLENDLRAATRRAYDNLIELCEHESAQLLVLAGDIYDGDWDSHATGEYFVRGLRRLADSGIAVAIVHGNHDAESQITRRLTMPAGVHVLSTSEPETHVFDDIGVAVHGQGYEVRDTLANLVQHYPEKRRDLVNVGVLHTGLQGVAGHARYAPCAESDLSACGYDYFALGHVHQREQVVGGRAPAWFSGNLQGRHPRETGAKGALVVDLEIDGEAQVRFAECDVARWEVLQPDIADCADVEAVVAAMETAYRGVVGAAEGRPLVVRFDVSGETDAAADLLRDAERLDADARAFLRAGSALDKVSVEVRPRSAALPTDPELADLLGRASEALAEDPDAARALLVDLRKQGVWRLAKGADLDLDDDAVMTALVERAGRELTAQLGGAR